MVAAINQDDASIYHSSVKSLLTHLYQISIWSILILNLPRDSGESSVLSLQPHMSWNERSIALQANESWSSCLWCVSKNISIASLRKKDHRHRIATKIWSSFKSNYDNHWSLNWSLNWWYKWWRSMVWSSCCDTLEILELIICSTKKQHFFCNSHILWKLIDTDLNWNNASV